MARKKFPSLPDLRRPHLQIPFIYATVAAVWIVFSDEIVALAGADREMLLRLSIVKGWLFVTVTALLLQHLIRRKFSALEASSATLAVSAERFSGAFRLSPMAMEITSFADGKLLDVNEAWLRTFGFERDEVIGRTKGELAIDDGGERRAGIVRTIEQGGEARDLEFTLRRKTGEPIEVVISADTIYLSGERHLLVVIMDITSRRRAETTLEKQAALLRERNQVLARYNRAVVDRELRVVELKRQVNELSSRLGEAPPYRLDFVHDDCLPVQGASAGSKWRQPPPGEKMPV